MDQVQIAQAKAHLFALLERVETSVESGMPAPLTGFSVPDPPPSGIAATPGAGLLAPPPSLW
jgi:hypothetical protein